MVHITMNEIVARNRALADPMRVLILRLLLERELCVCELIAILEEPQYKVSRHLTVLKNAGLVTEWREGTWIHHGIAPTLTPEWRLALQGLRDAWDQLPALRELVASIALRVTRQPGMACGDGPCTTRQASTCRRRSGKTNNIVPQQQTGADITMKGREV